MYVFLLCLIHALYELLVVLSNQWIIKLDAFIVSLIMLRPLIWSDFEGVGVTKSPMYPLMLII